MLLNFSSPFYLLSLLCLYSTVLLSPNRGGFVAAIFYRNIPFRYKTTDSVEQQLTNPIDDFGMEEGQIVPKERGENNENNKNKGIRAVLNQIEEEESRLLLSSPTDDDGADTSRRSSLPPRRTARLIALLPTDEGAANSASIKLMAREIELQQPNADDAGDNGNEEYGSGSISNSNPDAQSAFSPASSSLHSLAALRPDYAFKNVANFFRNFFDSRTEEPSGKSETNGGGGELYRLSSSSSDDDDWWARSMSI